MVPFLQALIQLAQDRSYEDYYRREAVTAIGSIGPPALIAVPALLSLSRGRVYDEDQHDHDLLTFPASEALFGIGKETIPLLVNALADGDAHVRCTAVMALRRFGPDARQAIPALSALLKDPDSEVRGESEQALEEIQGKNED